MKTKTKFKQTEIGLIPEEWEIKILSRLGKIITGKTPSSNNLEQFGDSYLFLTPTDFGSFNKNIYSTERMISEEGKNKFSSLLIPKNSVIVTCIGSDMGKVAINKKLCLTNQQINSIIINETNYFEFIYYKLKNSYSLLRSIATSGSTMPIVNKTDFGKIKLSIPEFKEQRAIASVLSSFDDKIELLEKQNEILEKIGEAFFKHWFVDFEFPNEKGLPYKSSGGKMVYNKELQKEIPQGWEVSKIGDKLETILGGTPSRTSEEYWNGKIPWINSGAINNFPIINASEYISQVGLKNSAAKLMPKGTIVLPFVISTNKEVKISILAIDSSGNQSVLGILPKDRFSSGYIYYWVQKQKEKIYSSATGGAQQHINKKNVDFIELLIPEEKVINNFNLIANNIFNKIYLNSGNILNLKQTRDLLLPKLMSGKIRVI